MNRLSIFHLMILRVESSKTWFWLAIFRNWDHRMSLIAGFTGLLHTDVSPALIWIRGRWVTLSFPSHSFWQELERDWVSPVEFRAFVGAAHTISGSLICLLGVLKTVLTATLNGATWETLDRVASRIRDRSDWTLLELFPYSSLLETKQKCWSNWLRGSAWKRSPEKRYANMFFWGGSHQTTTHKKTTCDRAIIKFAVLCGRREYVNMCVCGGGKTCKEPTWSECRLSIFRLQILQDFQGFCFVDHRLVCFTRLSKLNTSDTNVGVHGPSDWVGMTSAQELGERAVSSAAAHSWSSSDSSVHSGRPRHGLSANKRELDPLSHFLTLVLNGIRTLKREISVLDQAEQPELCVWWTETVFSLFLLACKANGGWYACATFAACQTCFRRVALNSERVLGFWKSGKSKEQRTAVAILPCCGVRSNSFELVLCFRKRKHDLDANCRPHLKADSFPTKHCTSLSFGSESAWNMQFLRKQRRISKAFSHKQHNVPFGISAGFFRSKSECRSKLCVKRFRFPGSSERISGSEFGIIILWPRAQRAWEDFKSRKFDRWSQGSAKLLSLQSTADEKGYLFARKCGKHKIRPSLLFLYKTACSRWHQNVEHFGVCVHVWKERAWQALIPAQQKDKQSRSVQAVFISCSFPKRESDCSEVNPQSVDNDRLYRVQPACFSFDHTRSVLSFSFRQQRTQTNGWLEHCWRKLIKPAAAHCPSCSLSPVVEVAQGEDTLNSPKAGSFSRSGSESKDWTNLFHWRTRIQESLFSQPSPN